MQFFNTKDEYIPKELAVFDGLWTCHCVFSAPYAFSQLEPKYQRQAEWLMETHHTIRWGTGYGPLQQLQVIMKQFENYTVFVKGRDKTQFIQKYLNGLVKEIEEEKQPAIGTSMPSCFIMVG